MVSSDGAAWAYHFRGGVRRSEALVDPLSAHGPGMVSRGLLDRIHAYLLAGDMTGGSAGAMLAAELEHELEPK